MSARTPPVDLTARAVKEWIGSSPDAAVPPRVKLRLFDKAYGLCQSCARHLGDGKVFHADHIIALVNGGKNRERNLQILCAWCHADKTKADVAIKSRTYRKRAKHYGIRQSSHPMPCGRKSPWKKTISGRVQRRDNG